LIDEESRIAFAACESNATVAAFDLITRKEIGTYHVGDDPDVLAFDKALKRLYVSAESGTVTILGEKNKAVDIVARGFFAPKAHTVDVDNQTHRVYFPLEDVDGKPVLRIVVPSDLH